jgi:hypothetical protein
MQPPQCSSCGAIVTNPAAAQCIYCGAALPPAANGYGAAQAGAQGYGQGTYGQPYGQPPYGQPYGQPPYAAPYAQPPVAGFNGVPAHGSRGPRGGGGFWSAVGTVGNVIWWIRIGIGVLVLGLFLLGSCVSALSH